MFNLIVRADQWANNRDTFPAGRVLEYTETHLVKKFMPEDNLHDAVMSLPTLFMQETFGDQSQPARVGRITGLRRSGKNFSLEYFYDQEIPPMANSSLQAFAAELDMRDFEFSRTHWAIKDADLFHVLLRNLKPRQPRPRIFQIADPENVESTLVSAMMPFHPHFDHVYAAINHAAEATGLHCRRADNIWENPAVMQDVVSLIDRSNIVVCDCTGRNPNVFYETGIAHTLGREVILITQNEADIPFDLRYLRYLTYLNNSEGLAQLSERLQGRFGDLVGS